MSAKHPFAIVVDGTTVLAPDARRDLDIRFLPLHVSFGAESYTAGVDLTSEQFYARIAQPNAKPTTSQPSIGECREIYEAAVGDGYDKMLVLTVATEFSGTYSVASTTAGQILDTEIVVVDTHTTAGSIGLIATACARARQAGRSLAETATLARTLSDRAQLLALIDTLDFLRRSGRISGAAAMFGSLLSMKPILEIAHGKAESIDRARTREKGMALLKELITARIPAGSRIHASTLHCNAPERARALGEWVQQQYHCVEYWTDEAGPVLAAHAGPGTVALCWYREEDLTAP
ncbi:MAG TPA: DegV family protein [Candidatus Saccharimonadales bacterium]|nr:DegV family protein [Candidatus Saccharimonadales bacterium]